VTTRLYVGAPPALIAAHRRVQDTAKAVLRELAEYIGPDATEQSIAAQAAMLLERRGIVETWYHDCPALVLLGSRSCLSVSGREYRPALDEPAGQTNLVTIDLSPMQSGHWGDCARSFPIEQGRVTFSPATPAFAAGFAFLPQLHASMRELVRPTTTFHELASWAQRELDAAGFENLDFRGNVGHSIATRRQDRLYIEAGNHRALGEVDFFTFEPHVRAKHDRWGFKHENIYCFDPAGRLSEL
jgi:Xaa-Pro aminopeptidase